jgi:hypothetical protein
VEGMNIISSDPRARYVRTFPSDSLVELFFFLWRYIPNLRPWPTSMKLSVSLRFYRSYTVGRTPWAGEQLVARPLPVHKH